MARKNAFVQKTTFKEELLAVLNTAEGEREILKYLKTNPLVIFWAFVGTGGHSNYIISEFPFGSKFRADFVIAFSYSGNWVIHVIELEAPSDKVITKSGRPTKAFNSAISQIGDWKEFIERNPAFVRQDLSDWCMKKDILGRHQTKRPPSNYSGNFLKDAETHVRYCYHIVIGRRKSVTTEIRRKMNQHVSGDFDVCTFDRFVDIAENLDRANGKEPGICLTQTEPDFR
jgi:hypothetical protein